MSIPEKFFGLFSFRFHDFFWIGLSIYMVNITYCYEDNPTERPRIYEEAVLRTRGQGTEVFKSFWKRFYQTT